MLKQKTHIEMERNGKDYSFVCEPDSSIADVYEVLSAMRSYVYGRLAEQKETAKPEVEESKPE